MDRPARSAPQLSARVVRSPTIPGGRSVAGDAAIVAISQLSAAARHALPAFGLRAAAPPARDGAAACLLGPDWAFEAAAAREGPAQAVAAQALDALRASQQSTWRIGGAREWHLEGPIVMGIVNATPDSFSDGGAHGDAAAAAAAVAECLRDGARIVDVGGESTRPNAAPVSADEEAARVLPIFVEARAKAPDALLSIDTVKARVASQAVKAGASLVNDVSGLTADPAMADTVAALQVPVIVGHRRGDPATMQSLANYGDVVAEVADELAAAVERAVRAGIARERIFVDPGLGFSKTAAHNWEILRRLAELRSLGLPIVVGPSRKSFLGELLGGRPARERDDATLACATLAAAAGASVLRVHRVRPAVDALAVVAALLSPDRSVPNPNESRPSSE